MLVTPHHRELSFLWKEMTLTMTILFRYRSFCPVSVLRARQDLTWVKPLQILCKPLQTASSNVHQFLCIWKALDYLLVSISSAYFSICLYSPTQISGYGKWDLMNAFYLGLNVPKSLTLYIFQLLVSVIVFSSPTREHSLKRSE